MSDWMLWNRFGGSIQFGSAPPPRLYLIPLSRDVLHEGPLALQLGHANRDERNLEGLTRAVDRAVSCESDAVIFPSSFLTHPLRDEFAARCRHRKLRLVHQVTTDSLISNSAAEIEEELLKRLEGGDALNLVFGADSRPENSLLARLAEWPAQVYFTYSVRSKDQVIKLLQALPVFIGERLFFHFPFHLEFGDGHFNCRQIGNLISKIQTEVPSLKVRPMLGAEVYDPRVDPTLELEPMIWPEFELRLNAGADYQNRVPIDVSVIIPSYNNRDYLLNTVNHLARQDYPRGNFEVIVVDDGSTDGTDRALRQLARSLEGQINFKYIFSPRLKPRKMGDANYRAGISRNLGVKNATGTILSFLDSDILTPTDFISDLVEKHRHFDVVQCKRLNLVREKSNDSVRFEEIVPHQDTFSAEGDYWEKFHALKDWAATPFFWKYTCTYGLSVSAQLFKRVGWIRRGFIFYGFEDVELGYRLARVGARFYLNEMVTYHLFHKTERSEFHNSDYLRQSLLAKTAQIFFLNVLEPEIFLHFRGLMNEQLTLWSFLSFILNKTNSPWVRRMAHSLLIPVLALLNWRWFAWHNWNRTVRPMKRILTPIGLPSVLPSIQSWLAGLQVWRVRVALGRVFSVVEFWRLRVAAQRLAGELWRFRIVRLRVVRTWNEILQKLRPSVDLLTYPPRKIYYFAAYQLRTRLGQNHLPPSNLPPQEES